jgi:hypothetical protein
MIHCCYLQPVRDDLEGLANLGAYNALKVMFALGSHGRACAARAQPERGERVG